MTLIILIASSLLAGSLAGCGLLDNAEPAAGTATITPASAGTPTAIPTSIPPITPTSGPVQTTLTIWHSWDESQLAVFQEIIDQFQDQFPEVQFDVLYIPRENLRARIEAAILEGGGPDLFFGPVEWGAELYNSGVLANLAEDFDDGLLRTINPAALESSRARRTFSDSAQQALVGLPYALQGVVLFRNKAILPRPAVTFDEMAALAKTATQGEIIGADLERSFFFSGGHLTGVGGALIGADGEPAFNNEAGLKWIELLKALENVGPTEFLSDRDVDLFKQGRVGWIIDGTWNIPALAEAIGNENLAIDPWPSYPGGGLSGYVQPANVYLSATTESYERIAAQNFMSHFLSPESQSLLTEAGFIPSVSGAKVLDPLLGRLVVQAMTALANGAPYPADPELPVYFGAMEQALQSIFGAGQTPAEALRIAQEAIKASLAQFEPRQTPTP